MSDITKWFTTPGGLLVTANDSHVAHPDWTEVPNGVYDTAFDKLKGDAQASSDAEVKRNYDAFIALGLPDAVARSVTGYAVK